MDPTKPPTRLKVVLLSLPPRTQAVLDYFFASTGRSSFEPTASDMADAAIFDVDTLESRQHWEAYRGRTGRPGIAMSIQPQQVPGAVWVRKPITPAALLNAAAELHAGRWTPDPAAVAPVAPIEVPLAAPVVPATAPAAVAAVAVVIEPADDRSAPPPVPLAAPTSSVVAPAVVAVAAPSLAVPVSPATAVEALPAVVPAATAPAATLTPRVETPAPQAVPAVPGELPAAPDAVTTGAAVTPSRPPATANTVAVRPASSVGPVSAPVAATPTRAPSPSMAPRVAVSSAPTVRGESRPSDRAASSGMASTSANRAGLGGFFKRLFGMAPEAPVAAPAAAIRPASTPPLTASRTVPPPPPAPTPVPSGAAPGTPSPDGELDGDDDGEDGDDSGWHEGSAGDAVTASRHPYTPGSSKLGSSKAARRRGRKVTTRWVDLSPATPPHADAHADTVVVEAVVVGAPDPAPVAEVSSAVNRPAVDPTPTPAAATDAVDAAVASLAEGTAAAPDAASVAEATPAETPRVATSWRVATTPQDLADEALYCGQTEDVSYEVLSHDRSRRYEPALSMVGALTEAYLVAGKWRVPTQLDCSAGRIVVDTTRNRVHLGFDAQQLPELWTTPIERRRKTQALNRQEQSALDALPTEAWQPLDRLLWRAGLLGAAGRLPEGTDLRAPVYLKHWPNLTRVQRTPHALRIAALWAIRGAGLMETAELLRIPQRHVFAFYNAALAMDLITADGSQVKRSQRRASRNRGLLTRLLGWLQH